MEEAILNFPEQLKYEPKIENEDKLNGDFKQAIVCGMGGSHLSTGLLKMYEPGINLYVHRDYGLPPYEEEFLKNSILIASSYSGNTEEVMDFTEEGYARGLNVVVIATGGKLIEFAVKNKLPFIKIPNTNIQPRSALGYSLIALAKILDLDDVINDLKDLSNKIKPKDLKNNALDIYQSIKGKTPIIYTSLRNLPLAYNWKIKFNETGKIPAFYNVFPELNHNEVNGFDLHDELQNINKQFICIILRDEEDHPQIQKRMEITEKLYEERGLATIHLFIEGESVFEKIFKSLILADWISLETANQNGENPEEVPIIEDLKKQL